MSSFRCSDCGGDLTGPRGAGEQLAQMGSAMFGLIANPGNTIFGQKSNYARLKCVDCGSTFSICPFCDTPTHAHALQASQKIRCPNCREEFVVGP